MDAKIKESLYVYAGHDFEQPQEIEIELFSENGYGEEWLLSDFLAKIAGAPPNTLMALADSEFPGFRTYYKRMETEEERLERVKESIERFALHQKDVALSERRQYERLKAKFEG